MDIYRYEPEDVYLRIRVSSELTDADSMPTARLVSNEPEPYSIDRALSVSKVSTGVYKAPLTMLDVAESRELIVNWSFTVSGVNATRSEYHQVVTPYNYIEDLQDVVPAGTSNDDIRTAAQAARLIIDSVCSQTFDRKYLTIDSFGSSKNVMTFNDFVLHVEKITSGDDVFYESGAESNRLEIDITPTKKGIKIISTLDPVFEDDGFLVHEEGVFLKDYKYTVKGIFGWDYVPSAIREAHRELVNDWFCKDSIWKRKYIEQMKSADWQFKLAPEAYTETGNFKADTLLRPYKNYSMVVP